MTLDEAIQHCEEVSKTCSNKQCSLDHLQLKEWLIELKNRRKTEEKTAAMTALLMDGGFML